MDIAEIVIGEIGKGADFAELAKEYSDHRSKRKGGDIGYIHRDMEYPVVAADAFVLKNGEYTKEPIRKRNGVYILKVEDRKVVTNDNIEEEIPDENNARGLAMRLRIKAAVEYENNLAMADDAAAFYKKISSPDTKTVLFEINDSPFTIADFDKEMADSGDKDLGKVLRERLGLQEALLLREAFKREINRAPEFIEGWKIIRRSTLADQYKNGVILSLARIEVTDEEIDMEYNKRMKKDDARTLPRESIVKLLKGRKRFEKKIKWEEELLAKNEFRVL